MLLQAKKHGIVTFICELKPDAQEVYLSGNFNRWLADSTRMLRAKDGSFRTSMTLSPGKYQYKFVVDGVWCDDPDAPRQDTNDTGASSSAFTVKEAAPV